MPIEEASEFFGAVPAIRRHLATLADVGLGYVRLGQPAPTLSGGEAQRVKLASELQRRSTGRTVYVLDEPTTGLHFEDVRKLLGVLTRLVEAGNTVIVIEHNLDVIKSADWVIDLGPEGGSGGGRIVAEGTPEAVAEVADSHTGGFLRGILARGRVGGHDLRALVSAGRAGRAPNSRSAGGPPGGGEHLLRGLDGRASSAGGRSSLGPAGGPPRGRRAGLPGMIVVDGRTRGTNRANRRQRPAVRTAAGDQSRRVRRFVPQQAISRGVSGVSYRKCGSAAGLRQG